MTDATTLRSPLLNIDLGELTDEPEALYELAELCNIACGGHAGDAGSMARAILLCRRCGALPGAHPAYPDPANFGRRSLALPPAEIAATVEAQCRRLREVGAAATGTDPALGHCKPHGALYHDAHRDPAIARALVGGAVAALGKNVRILGPAGGALEAATRAAGLGFLRESFADRGTRSDGTLIPRDQPGALIADPALAADTARALARSGAADTVCVHGDTPGAVAIARAVRLALDAARGPK